MDYIEKKYILRNLYFEKRINKKNLLTKLTSIRF